MFRFMGPKHFVSPEREIGSPLEGIVETRINTHILYSVFFLNRTVRIPENDFTIVDPNGNPTDPQLIESVCFTRTLDDWFVRKREADSDFWDGLGVEPRSMYFGSHNGAFRIFPGRQSEQCGVYDPRLRPWYVAGSSGPKNVVLVLDLSGSMQGSRLSNLKTAASRVVSTLTVSDRVLIVPFASDAYPITDNGFVFTATDENKAFLLDRIGKLQAGGGTNFFRGFEEAFNILDASIANEYTASCNTAVSGWIHSWCAWIRMVVCLTVPLLL